MNELEFKRLRKQGRLSLLVGLSFLAACFLVIELVMSKNLSRFPSFFKEGLTIAGWVAMWRPLEIYLYEWWPLRRRGQILDKLSRMAVEVRKRGYAEYTVADARFCFRIPEAYSDAEAAPLLCAGLIGYRSLVKAGDARRLGIYGFGAAAHIVAQVARHQGRKVFAFTRPGDAVAQKFASSLGAVWVGDSTSAPPEPLDAAIIFAPAGELVPQALRAVTKGGTVVCGGIHMSDIPSFPYHILWEERSVCSVANLTRRDGEGFLALAPRIPVRTEIETFPLIEANEALRRLRAGGLRGAAVLTTG